MWRHIRMLKNGIYKIQVNSANLTCHLHLSDSTLMCHMAGVVCLLQNCIPRHNIQALILLSLTVHHYLVFNILPKIPP